MKQGEEPNQLNKLAIQHTSEEDFNSMAMAVAYCYELLGLRDSTRALNQNCCLFGKPFSSPWFSFFHL